MASKTGICTNAAGCTLAYTKKPVTVAEGAEFRCPECGQPLQDAQGTTVGGGGKVPPWAIAAGAAVFLLIAAAFFIVPRMISRSSSTAESTPVPVAKPATPEPLIAKTQATPAPATPAPAEAVPATPAPVATPKVAAQPPPTATPMAKETAPTPPVEPPPDDASTSSATMTPLVENKQENAEVKKQVLVRIDSMPNLSPTNRSKLYTAVDRARGMYKMAIISFNSGRVTPTPAAVTQLVEGLHSPEVQRLLTDPTAVIIVLGYADPKGDEKKNLQISTERAESLSKALREQGKILNVMHAVGMGGSEMFGKGQRDKNRVVEIWAVLP
jgi:outer membrane protein OmpA-like peptidoglycan-associated protein